MSYHVSSYPGRPLRLLPAGQDAPRVLRGAGAGRGRGQGLQPRRDDQGDDDDLDDDDDDCDDQDESQQTYSLKQLFPPFLFKIVKI